MPPISVHAAARRTALAVAAVTVTATTVSVPATAAPVPAPVRPLVKPAAVTPGLLEVQLGRAVRGAERTIVQRRKRAAARRAAEAARRAAEAARTRGERIIDLARREAGDPYVWGAAGPNAFDCSGYTMHVFGQLGISLPHNSAAQAAVARRVSDPQVGDLVFFGGSGVYHVGIYAGDGTIWHSPRGGGVVRQERIWTGDVFYGRVG